MREIKFRAWDKKGKKWIRDFHILPNGQVLVGQGKMTAWIYAKKDVDLIQYTGLKDKNGKEIYEGDILSWLSEEEGLGEIYTVIFNEAVGEFMGRHKIAGNLDFNSGYAEDINTNEIEVIGNIYENTELLKIK